MATDRRDMSDAGAGDNAALALVRLLTFLSPAFPTGGFAYSHGLEFAVEAGDVTTAAQLTDWLAALLSEGPGRNDAILLRLSHRSVCAEMSGSGLGEIATLARAMAPSAELALETLQQGNAFATAATPWATQALTEHLRALAPLAYPVAVGALAAAQAIDEEPAVAGYLQAWTASLVSAGIRLIPLGQTAGLSVQSALETRIMHVAGMTRAATPDDLGSACPRADIASTRHETQYTRLFRS